MIRAARDGLLYERGASSAIREERLALQTSQRARGKRQEGKRSAPSNSEQHVESPPFAVDTASF
jgi:hypothetical protein